MGLRPEFKMSKNRRQPKARLHMRECDFCACAIQDLSELTMEEPENKCLLTVKCG